MKLRSVCAWLCTLLVIPTIASCGDAAATTPADTDAVTAPATEVTLSEEEIKANALSDAISHIPEVDYGGRDFTIMDRDAVADANWETIDVFSEGEDGDAINDAVYQRNRILSENMNITVKAMPVQNPYTTAKKLVLAGDGSFDIVTDGLNQLATIATAGCLYDLKNLPGLSLSNAWWDQQMNTELTIGGKLFFATGDISIMDNYGTWCIMFNKTIAQDYDLADIYQYVRDGKWTIDVMYDMAKQVTKDLNGDGVLDNDDQWGYFTEGYNQYGLWAACDEKIIEKDADDLPVLAGITERSVSAMEKVSMLQKDTAVTLSAERLSEGCAFTNEGFGNGRALFIYGGMWLITKFRAYDINFGVVPAPKYDETQENYCNTYSYANCTAYGVPVTVSDPTCVGTVMEAMAEISKYTLTPAYYEISLKGKFVRDEESAEMLDIILAQRSYDLGMIFDWGGMFSMITGLSSGNGDFSSSYAKKESAAVKAIDKFVTTLEELG